MCIHFIWVYISMYVDNGTTKLPVSAEILVRNQGLAIGILK